MTCLERDIKIFLLKALRAAAGQPLPHDTLKASIRNAFSHVAFTDLELQQHIADAETDNLIAGVHDEIMGLVWALTPKGRIRAAQLK